MGSHSKTTPGRPRKRGGYTPAMFSRRLQWPYPENRLSRLLEEKRRRGVAVLDLTESNPTRVGLRYPEEAIAEALRAAAAPAYDPAPRGLVEARAAVRRGTFRGAGSWSTRTASS